MDPVIRWPRHRTSWGERLISQGHDCRVDLRWPPVTDREIRGYNIYRGDSPDGPFAKLNPDIHQLPVYSDFIGENDRAYYYYVVPVDIFGKESARSQLTSAMPRAMTDDQLLTSVQEAAFRYFWDFADPQSGLAREGLVHPCDTCTTGGTGFGMLTIMVAAERGFVTREQAAARLLLMTRFLEEKATRYHGVWSHWLNGNTGETIYFAGPADNGGDLVETSFLMRRDAHDSSVL